MNRVYCRKYGFSVLIAVALSLLVTSGMAAAGRSKQPRKVRLEQATVQRISPGSVARYDSTCVARNDDGIYWRLNGWVIGQEIYKRYINPADSCGALYPFEVIGVGILLNFGNPGTIQLSADIELADTTNPGCPAPGTLLGSASATHEFTIPEAGLYDLFVPLDQPITVTAPFFAGMFIANIVDSADLVGLIIDSSSHWPNPLPCWSYNAWDSSGYHDLVNNEFWNFPGRLVMYASVTPGSSGCCQVVGDVEHSGSIDITDLTWLIDYIFNAMTPPVCPEEGDVDGSGSIDISDLTYLIDYMFHQGSPPGACPL